METFRKKICQSFFANVFKLWESERLWSWQGKKEQLFSASSITNNVWSRSKITLWKWIEVVHCRSRDLVWNLKNGLRVDGNWSDGCNDKQFVFPVESLQASPYLLDGIVIFLYSSIVSSGLFDGLVISTDRRLENASPMVGCRFLVTHLSGHSDEDPSIIPMAQLWLLIASPSLSPLFFSARTFSEELM